MQRAAPAPCHPRRDALKTMLSSCKRQQQLHELVRPRRHACSMPHGPQSKICGLPNKWGTVAQPMQSKPMQSTKQSAEHGPETVFASHAPESLVPGSPKRAAGNQSCPQIYSCHLCPRPLFNVNLSVLFDEPAMNT